MIDEFTGLPVEEPFSETLARARDEGLVRVFALLNEPGAIYLVRTNEDAAIFQHALVAYGPAEVSDKSAYLRGTFHLYPHHITDVPGLDEPVDVIFWDPKEWQREEWRKTV